MRQSTKSETKEENADESNWSRSVVHDEQIIKFLKQNSHENIHAKSFIQNEQESFESPASRLMDRTPLF